MTPDEQALLLTVARIFRAQMQDQHRGMAVLDDLRDLNDALRPFGPLHDETAEPGEAA